MVLKRNAEETPEVAMISGMWSWEYHCRKANSERRDGSRMREFT